MKTQCNRGCCFLSSNAGRYLWSTEKLALWSQQGKCQIYIKATKYCISCFSGFRVWRCGIVEGSDSSLIFALYSLSKHCRSLHGEWNRLFNCYKLMRKCTVGESCVPEAFECNVYIMQVTLMSKVQCFSVMCCLSLHPMRCLVVPTSTLLTSDPCRNVTQTLTRL